MSSLSAHPTWHGPFQADAKAPTSGLRLFNSLTDQKDEFVTIDPEQKLVTWYICGPTVYDSAHLGHARAYVTFDIIRRVLEKYFGYSVFYVMNITDIDDKIILRARRNHLLARYEEKLPAGDAGVQKLMEDASAAFAWVISQAQQKLDAKKSAVASVAAKDKADLQDRIKQDTLKLGLVETAKRTFDEEVKRDERKQDGLLAAAGEVLSQHLDHLHGAQVDDQKIFRAHAAYYESEFLQDMRDLNVQDATVITRVTEYVPQVIDYILKIIKNGFAYESAGSVYFDVQAFAASHDYAKLSPQSAGNLRMLEEGEGALAAGSEKRHTSDFALWKNSKAGEPAWKSPWGMGRPGWHIECSVMASEHLGPQMDIHSGGVDLKFPHHDNELAQAEAHFSNHQWVNFFLHAGHLHIAGLKMSKSLKNFLTIRQVLDKYTARQLRLLFLLQGWNQPMQYSDQSLQEAIKIEKSLSEFFLTVQTAVREVGDLRDVPQRWHPGDATLHGCLLEAQRLSHERLLDNLDYTGAMRALLDLITHTNKHMASLAADQAPNVLLLKSVAQFIHHMLSVFGVVHTDSLSFDAGSSSQDAADVIAPVVDIVVAFREKLRAIIKDSKTAAPVKMKELLQACDDVRDRQLPQVGVRLEDKSGRKAAWKYVDPDQLRAEMKQQEEKAKKESLLKLESRAKLKRTELERLLKGVQTPQERFESEGKFGGYDDTGMPTTDNNGQPLTKSGKKGAAKNFKKYKQEHAKFQAKGGMEGVQKLKAEIKRLDEEVAVLNEELGFA